MDCGAGHLRTFWHVTLPGVRVALVAACLLGFTLSMDEIAVTYFLAGTQPTLPVYVWGLLRFGFTPEVNAAFTLIAGGSLLLIGIAGVLLFFSGGAIAFPTNGARRGGDCCAARRQGPHATQSRREASLGVDRPTGLAMRYGIFLPNFGPFGDPKAVVELAITPRSSGWDGLFIWDHIQPRRRRHRSDVDPWVALTAVASGDLEPADRDDDHAPGAPAAVEGRPRDGDPRPLLRRPADPRRRPRLPAGGRVRDLRRRDRRPRAGGSWTRASTILDGLWSGATFSYDGRALQVRRRPVSRRGPSSSRGSRSGAAAGGRTDGPFRRAAALGRRRPGDGRRALRPTPAQVAEIAAYVGARRPASLSTSRSTATRPGRRSRPGSIAEYGSAGLTWWLERIDTDRLFSFDQAQQRVHAGPPRAAVRTRAVQTRKEHHETGARRQPEMRFLSAEQRSGWACRPDRAVRRPARCLWWRWRRARPLGLRRPPDSGETINLLTWQTYDEPEWLEEFEEGNRDHGEGHQRRLTGRNVLQGESQPRPVRHRPQHRGMVPPVRHGRPARTDRREQGPRT